MKLFQTAVCESFPPLLHLPLCSGSLLCSFLDSLRSGSLTFSSFTGFTSFFFLCSDPIKPSVWIAICSDKLFFSLLILQLYWTGNFVDLLFEGFLLHTSSSSAKSTSRFLGLEFGHLDPCRARLVAVASSSVLYYKHQQTLVMSTSSDSRHLKKLMKRKIALSFSIKIVPYSIKLPGLLRTLFEVLLWSISNKHFSNN